MEDSEREEGKGRKGTTMFRICSVVTAAAHLNIEIEYRIDSCFVRLVQRDALPRSSTPSLRDTKFTDAESKTERRDGGEVLGAKWARTNYRYRDYLHLSNLRFGNQVR